MSYYYDIAKLVREFEKKSKKLQKISFLFINIPKFIDNLGNVTLGT